MSHFKRHIRPLAAVMSAGLILAACGTDTEDEPTPAPEPAEEEVVEEDEDDGDVVEDDDMNGHDMDDMDEADVDVSAEQLRATLNRLLQEHVYLSGTATGFALQGNDEGFAAAATSLTEGNTADIADLMGSVYGDDVREQFFGFWNSHIDMFVDYTVAVAEGDEAAADDAVNRLVGYSTELAETLETLTGGEFVAEGNVDGIVMHVTSLKDVVDAQAAGEDGLTELREAAAHMDHLAEAIAVAIATQNGLEGDAASDLAGVQSDLNGLLQEHVYLAATFTGEALTGGDNVEAAQNALIGGNTEDLADLVAAVYGDRAERDDFVQFWNSHILMFVAYTEGVASGDEQAQADAVADLVVYGGELAATFDALTLGNLPADASEPLIVSHVTTLLPAIDAQGEGDFGTAFTELREAAAHMEMITFPLFDATVASL